MRAFLFASALFFSVWPVWASALSEQDCKEIQAKYQIWPKDCGPAGTAAVGLSEEQKESNIFFTGGGLRLDAAARSQLTSLAAVLSTETLAGACIQLVGHTDASGSEKANEAIGLKRAQTVAGFLAPLLDNPQRISSVETSGESDVLPNLPPNDTRQRRVEIRARTCL